MMRWLRAGGVTGVALALLSCATVPTSDEYVFSGWEGPPINVRLHVPKNYTADSRVVFVMHGASRDAPRYFSDWQPLAERYGFVLVVPEFPVETFPGSRRYNLGWVFDQPDDVRVRPEPQWTFSVIEPLFDDVVLKIGSARDRYSLYGHSAGSQFVHRFLYYKPHARVERAVAANAGWYTLPTFNESYPYGLGNAQVNEHALNTALARSLTILLGTADNDPGASKLRHTPEAERQGTHRLARGKTMYAAAQESAGRTGSDLGWSIDFVDGAAHSNAQMAPAAAELIAEY